MRYIFTTCILLFVCHCISGQSKGDGSLLSIKLQNGWCFNEVGRAEQYPATVPGCVHTDLIDNKIIPDPFFGVNEKGMQWIGEKDWEYHNAFSVGDDILKMKNIDIVFKGLDTYASVYLNDELILTADNMFREWKVDCKGKLKKENKLKIVFKNVFSVNLPKWKSALFRLQAFPNNDQADTMIAVYSRKAQFHYGWDWGPRLITCGIWKDIIIEAWDDIKLCGVQVLQNNVSQKSAGIVSKLELLSASAGAADISFKINNSQVLYKSINLKEGLNYISLDYNLDNPRLWWTNGLGEQYLYDFEYTVKSTGGETVSKKYSIGIRSVELVRETDSLGKSFYFKVNGVPVFMKGANYIPQDNFQNRVTNEKYEYIVKSAADVNMNMLRIWGGGIFQDDAFFEMCDKYGILLWHDMMFACGMYPAEREFLESVKHEITDNITHIRNHPSLSFYCGNNENFVAWYNWGWKQKFDEATQRKFEQDMDSLYNMIIPQALFQADSTRAYSYSSPCAGYGSIQYSQGDIHYWGVWHGQEPFENYEKNVARFVSEYGFQSYPELSTVEKYTNPGDRELHSEVMLSHQRCMADDRKDKEYGNRLIKTYMEMYYKTPKDFENYLYVSQVLHAEGGRYAIEAHRRNMPYCMGSLYWQINDCWPVASWASIDYFGNWKALHYYTRRLYAPVIIIPTIKQDKVDFYIVSDELKNIDAEMQIKCYDMKGKELSGRNRNLEVKSNSSNIYYSCSVNELLNGAAKEDAVVEVKLLSDGKIIGEKIFYFVKPKELKLREPEQLSVNINKTEKEIEVELKSDVLLKDVCISLQGETAWYSDNYFDLIPGNVKKIKIKTEKSISGVKEKLKIISLRDSY